MFHVALITDDGYLLPTLVTTKSILENNKGRNIIVHICTFGFNDESVKIINNFIKNEGNLVVNIFDKSLLTERLSSINQKSHVTPVALIKFELANYFDKINTMLYLDSDIIVDGCLDSLFSVDISHYYLAASFEFWNYINNYRFNFGRKATDFYFNSGVMLLNLKKMREDNVAHRLWNYKLNHAKTKLMDQECLNCICASKSLPISIKYNFNPFFLNEKYINAINYVYAENYKDVKNLKKELVIIHYVGKFDKPWAYENACYRAPWDKYYNSIEHIPQIKFIEYSNEKISLFQRIRNRIRNVGILGFISSLFFRRIK
ncbi:glycosyltransferase family 8 protein [Eubacterium sp. MSJ-33]|uniref:glycosyltransferase family 8 protein n=1 Tax=Eubacterium sp. MSJ-33 TaxID=2841528 RepID=UPI001C758402|nr:glycosyltransferase [Eubacterium sp. MSJ-33]QWT52211.1 hypothetical protein KP625_08925 [Eubacterium sp. MSJ-33]